ncbi:MAG: Ig-like domain-containing protein [Bacteroidetes bacterium]|nr:Ig-like domain-containing protein [Bacteroidota bacterium]
MHTLFQIRRIPPPITVALLWLLVGCASQRPPEGGPPDTDPPYIIRTVPENRIVRFDGTQVSFVFNEYVQRQSFQDALHVSPLPETPPEIKWSGRRVTLRFAEDLLENRTYVITIGTNVRDLRAGNEMTETMHLAFSTGDSLDNGTFSGTVHGEPRSGVSLFAYLIDEERADTLDPAEDRPDYLVQSGQDGAFQFFNVLPGRYRVFAIRDKNNTLRYNAEIDEIGIPVHDVVVEDSTEITAPLRFHLHTEDTTRPAIQRVEALNERLVRVKFNETIYPQPPPSRFITITDSSSGERHFVIAVTAPPEDRYAWDLLLGHEMMERPFLLVIDSLEDGVGNALITDTMPLSFTGSVRPDTAMPLLISRYPEPNTVNVPPDSSFSLRFDRPVNLDEAFALRDSSDNIITLQMRRPDALRVDLLHPPLMEEAVYTFCVDLRQVRDSLTAQNVGDSTECITFTSGRPGEFGTLTGVVRTEDSTNTVIVRVRNVAAESGIRTAQTNSTRQFQFEKLPEGRYIIDAYIDRNDNNRYDFGKTFPLIRPEPYGIHPDTLRVRARWETNDIIVPLPVPDAETPAR